MTSSSPALQPVDALFSGGGEMGARMRCFDWAASALGAPECWPQSLRTLVRLMLDSRDAMWMLWGPELTFFCNDALLPTLGLKRDWALGARSDSVWKEIWPDIGPRIRKVLERAESAHDEARRLLLERHGSREETYHTFSYSPVYDDGWRVAGALCVVTPEVTGKVSAEPRLQMPRDQGVPLERWDADLRFEKTFGARLLIAHDSAELCSDLRELLSRRYTVEAVSDGETALAAARRRPPDLILADALMPRLSGIGLLRAVRSDERLRRVPVVLLSERAGQEACIEGPDTGADDCLIKPFSGPELCARLGALLEQKQMREHGETRLKVGLAAARMVIWDWDLKSDRVQFSDNARDVFGAEWSERAFERHLIHPEDWGPHEKAIREALRAGATLRSEIRMRRPDTGELRWYEICGQIEYDRSGEPRSITGASVDVTERKRVEEALRDMDRRKDEFLAMLAHELRNPLAPIQTGSELLERNFQADESIHSIAAMVKRQVAQLARLVDDLLDVSRITQGRIELKREPVELGEVVQRSLESVMLLMHEREHQVESIAGVTPLYVRGDVARLVQSLVNLLQNAAKYTDRGGNIRVEARRERGFGVIEVRDNGIGIGAELLPRVFELFVQGDRSLDRSQGGLGIGLSVVKRLVEMHGGSVSAVSAGERQGSVFQIRLPLIAEPAQRAMRSLVSAPPEPRRVLVIDDNVDAADTLCMLLKVAGHAAEAVYGARAALERLGEFNAEAALVDIGLPDMNGYDLARQIRARSGRIQLIALTGYGQPEDLARSREAGFDAHMIKPVEIGAVEAVLARGRPLN